MIVELLPMVIGQRSEYTSSFIAFLNETKKPEVGREGGRQGGKEGRERESWYINWE